MYITTHSISLIEYTKDFFNVIEDESVANENIAKQTLNIYAYQGNIFIDSDKEESVSIYNMNGQIVRHLKTQGKHSIPLKRGFYIVNVKNDSVKVFVK